MTTHADAAATKSGDLVLLDFELWAEGGGRTDLIDTSREEVASTAGVKPTEGATYGPRPHHIGGDYFPGGIEAALVGVPVGTEVTKEFPPADAFGERDPKLIELFSMHEISRLPEMRREDADLDVGTVLNIRNRRGRVVSLTAARVRVDFNPPFAGRKIRSTFKVVELLTDPEAQARAVVDLAYGRGKEFGVKVHQHVVTLKVPDRAKFDLGWFAAKPRLIERLRSSLKPKSIEIVEEYLTPSTKSTAEPTGAAAPASESDSPEGPAAHSHARKGSKAEKSAAEPSETTAPSSEDAPDTEPAAHSRKGSKPGAE
jgi:FKBP-type peptidyl-prolyl cis-trans isomerase 2